MVYKLRRSLYDPAQSPALWYDTIDAALVTLGFTPTRSDARPLATSKTSKTLYSDRRRATIGPELDNFGLAVQQKLQIVKVGYECNKLRT